MSLFAAIVRTAVNVATLPMAVAKDALTLGNAGSGDGSFIARKLQQLKDEAGEDAP